MFLWFVEYSQRVAKGLEKIEIDIKTIMVCQNLSKQWKIRTSNYFDVSEAFYRWINCL